MINPTKLLSPLFALALIAVPALVSAQEESREYPLNGFDRIELRGSSELEIIQGDTFEVVATGDPEVLAKVVAEVNGGTLELSVEDRKRRFMGMVTVSDNQSVDFRVTLPKLEALSVTGSGDARAELIESESLELRVQGSGGLFIKKVAAQSLDAAIVGSGDLELGTVLSVNTSASIRGSGDLKYESLAGESLRAAIMGSGDMVIGGRIGTLNVSVMGSGDFVGRALRSDRAEGSVMGSGDVVLLRPTNGDSFNVMGSGDIAFLD